jgi:hypothetical protein
MLHNVRLRARRRPHPALLAAPCAGTSLPASPAPGRHRAPDEGRNCIGLWPCSLNAPFLVRSAGDTARWPVSSSSASARSGGRSSARTRARCASSARSTRRSSGASPPLAARLASPFPFRPPRALLPLPYLLLCSQARSPRADSLRPAARGCRASRPLARGWRSTSARACCSARCGPAVPPPPSY